jgi:DNA modification methylase
MKTYMLLKKAHRFALPPEFQHYDVRYPESLVERFLREFTQAGDVVFDPFAGYGTTLLVAEEMGRVPFGIEFDERRARYVRSRLQHPENLIHGDSRQLSSYNLPLFDFSITSPPYMGQHDPENPLAACTTGGSGYAATESGYAAYLQDLRNIYEQIGQIMKPGARAVIEVSNLKLWDGLTALAWDVAGAVSQVLHFEGEVIVGWDSYGYGYDHSYCLVFARPA